MRALALSGGAAFGAYQAGAWEALSEAGWRPDVALGVSIGAVNAFAISRGAAPDDMRRLWLELPAELSPAPQLAVFPWRKHVGLFHEWVREVHATYVKRPTTCGFRALLLEAPAMRFRLIEEAEVSVEHLVAACALPGVLAPMRLNGSWLLDAGALRHLPLREATASGADEIVSVDLLANHPMPLARLSRRAALAVRDLAYGERSEPRQADLAALNWIRVEHPTALGGILGSFEWNRERSAELIRRGAADARQALAVAAQHPSAAAAAALK